MSIPKNCPRCTGWIYADDPFNRKSDIWCLMCGEWVNRPTPLPFIGRNTESFHEDAWYIDEHGDIIDIIDQKIENLVKDNVSLNVSAVAKRVGCSNADARMTLERLVRNKVLIKYTYGPQDRWIGYRKAPYTCLQD